MDPNTTLHELREMVAQALLTASTEHLALAQKFDELDGWMSRGGFAPDAWRETEDHR